MSKDKTIWDKMQFIWSGELTKRFHIRRTIQTNTVAEHSFTVMWLLYVLSNDNPSKNLLLAGMTHDISENVTGDMPGNVQKELGELGDHLSAWQSRLLKEYDWYFEITPQEQRLLNMADWMAGMLFCCSEKSMGNKNVNDAYLRWQSYVHRLNPVGIEEVVFLFIQTTWRDA